MLRAILCCAVLWAGGASAAAQVSPLGQLRLEITDLAGNPVSVVSVGDDFLVKGYVLDVRETLPSYLNGGVFAAGFDITFDDTLASGVGPITHGSFFNLLQDGTLQPGLLDDVAAATLSFTEPGQVEQFLFSVPFHAHAPGEFELTSTLSTTKGRDFLLYGHEVPLTLAEVAFFDVGVTIVPEPASAVLAALACGAFAAAAARSRSKRVLQRAAIL